MTDRKDVRRKEILGAAYKVFIQYGYGKTTFDDIAHKAGVSRTLLYAYFDDKKDLFLSVARELLDGQGTKTEAILKSKEADEQKLVGILQLWSVELYADVADSPHGGELLDEGYRAWEQIGVHYKEKIVRAVTPFVGGPDVAEIIILALKGLQADRPSVPVLRKRVKLLAEVGMASRGKG